MSFQAYLDSVKAKTGKSAADFAKLAGQLRLGKHGEIVAWLKRDFALGHGHATAVAAVLLKGDRLQASDTDRLARLFSGKKAAWRAPCERLLARLAAAGTGYSARANQSYLNLLRGEKKFALLQPSAGRLDVGLRLPEVAPAGRLQAAGSWNAMVTHRVRVADPKELDAELLRWLKQAYVARA